MQATQSLRANALVSPTWNRLSMNGAEIEVLDTIAAGAAEIELPAGVKPAAFGAYEASCDAVWATRPEQAQTQVKTQPDAEILNGAEVNLDLAAESPVTRDVAKAYERGTGQEAYEWLAAHAATTQAIEIPANAEINAPIVVRVNGQNACAAVASLSIVAHEGAKAQVLVCLNSDEMGEGIIGSALSVFAAAGAKVDIQSVHTAGEGFTTIDETSLFIDDAAQVTVRHTVLGAGKSYVGLAGNLSGTAADARITTRYVGHGSETLDFNYLLRHRGKKTTCFMEASGVLSDSCSKTLRGTIDLVNGCSGAEGTETESVVLADERVTNKSIPIILCSEDDVAGNHGATIGHMRPEQLNYLMSRGISQQAAERLLAIATFEDAAINTPDAATRDNIVTLAQRIGIPAQFDMAE